MKSRRFQPTVFDALENRLVLTAIPLPFTLVFPPAGQVKPQFLNLTGRTESQINQATSNAFNRFTHDYLSELSTYNKGIAKPGADQSALLEVFNTKSAQSYHRLTKALNDVSHKVPFGGLNLYQYLNNRIVGAPIDPATPGMIIYNSLETKLTGLGTSASTSDIVSAISVTQSRVRTDINDFINLGVTNGDFKLTRGATLPPLS